MTTSFMFVFCWKTQHFCGFMFFFFFSFGHQIKSTLFSSWNNYFSVFAYFNFCYIFCQTIFVNFPLVIFFFCEDILFSNFPVSGLPNMVAHHQRHQQQYSHHHSHHHHYSQSSNIVVWLRYVVFCVIICL